jgi:hypothetical protein
MSRPRHVVRATFPIEKYARVMAALSQDRIATPEEILGRLQVSPEEWAEADAVWSEALAEARRKGQGEWALRFATAFFRARGGVPTFAPSELRDGAASAAPETPAKDRPVQMPTYQLAEQEGRSRPPLSDVSPSTGELDVGSLQRAATSLPFAASAPSAPAPVGPPSPPVVAPRGRAMSGTIDSSSEEVEAKLAALRAASPAQMGLPMSLERYVEISVALAQSTDRDLALQAKGYDPARWASIQKSFVAAFERDAELHRRYVGMMKAGLGRAEG